MVRKAANGERVIALQERSENSTFKTYRDLLCMTGMGRLHSDTES